MVPVFFSARVERRQRGRSEPAEAQPGHRDGSGRREMEGGSQDGGGQVLKSQCHGFIL